jgi:hypothetical protein
VRVFRASWVVLCVACASAGGRSPTAAHLEYIVLLGKSEFYEGEPIYAVFVLRNAGPDTAFVPICHASQAHGFVRVSDRDGRDVPIQFGLQSDIWCSFRPRERGRALPPGRALYWPTLAYGYETDRRDREERFRIPVLAAGGYVVRSTWHQSERQGRRWRVRIDLTAPDITVSVRPRTPAEDSLYRDLRVVGARYAAWPRERGQLPFALEWAERRIAADSMDPFVVPALEDAVSRAAVGGELRRDDSAVARLAAIHLTAARAQRQLPAGAYAVLRTHAGQYYGYSVPDLGELLAGSLAGDVARSLRTGWVE